MTGILKTDGTLSATNGATAITLSAASWTAANVKAGDQIAIEGSTRFYFINSADYTAQTAEIWPAYDGTTASGLTYAVSPSGVGWGRVVDFNFNLAQLLSIVDGARGTNGIDAGLDYTFDATTTAADPGAGKIRLNNATLSSATAAYVDNSDANGNDVSAYLDTLGGFTLYLIEKADRSKCAIFTIGTVTDSTGYRTMTLTHVSGSPTIADATELLLSVVPVSAVSSVNGQTGAVSLNIRETLTANRTYYVRPDGNDSNDGLSNTSGGAFLTIQHAVDMVTALDCSIYTPTISVAAGTYTENVTLSPIIGAARAVIVGDTGTPTNVVVQGNFNGVNCGNWQIKGFQIGGTSVYPLNFTGGATSIEIGYLNFSAITAANQILIANNAYLKVIGDYSISGQSTYAHMSVSYGAVAELYSKTVTVAADVTFSVFAVTNNGAINTGSMTYDLGAFTVTGQRYSASLAGVIRTGGGGASYFPGTTAGGTSTGGQYA